MIYESIRTIDAADIQEREGNGVYGRIAENLLIHVFYRVSALVAVEDAQRIACVKLFDTEFGAEYMVVPERAQEVWLISNHPEGYPAPYAADLENMARIRRHLPEAKLRLLICGEDIGCIEQQVAI